MKILLLLFISFIFNVQSFGQYTQIPDPNFEQALIDLKIDSGIIDGTVLNVNIIDITFLDVHSKKIKDLTGIEGFTSLESLDCSDNELISLDISHNPLLTNLSCNNNKLSALNLSSNPNLIKLICYTNLIKDLDFGNNLRIDEIRCGGNPLQALEITNNQDLRFLTCSQISDPSFILDISRNTRLTTLRCASNKFTHLDISKNTQLTELYCAINLLTNLDLTKNTKLIYLNFVGNKIQDLDISQNILLEQLYCSNNNLHELNIKNNPKLTNVWFSSNQITTIDFTGKSSLKSISCSRNPISCLNIAASETTIKKFSLRAKNCPNLSCIEVGKMDTSLFKTLELDSGLTLDGNCINDCSSPFDTTDVASANISIYPNPTNGEVTINFNKEIVRELQVSLLNIIGQEIKYYKASNVSEFTIEINESSGVYFLQLIANSSSPIIYKVLKQ